MKGAGGTGIPLSMRMVQMKKWTESALVCMIGELQRSVLAGGGVDESALDRASRDRRDSFVWLFRRVFYRSVAATTESDARETCSLPSGGVRVRRIRGDISGVEEMFLEATPPSPSSSPNDSVRLGRAEGASCLRAEQQNKGPPPRGGVQHAVDDFIPVRVQHAVDDFIPVRVQHAVDDFIPGALPLSTTGKHSEDNDDDFIPVLRSGLIRKRKQGGATESEGDEEAQQMMPSHESSAVDFRGIDDFNLDNPALAPPSTSPGGEGSRSAGDTETAAERDSSRTS